MGFGALTSHYTIKSFTCQFRSYNRREGASGKTGSVVRAEPAGSSTISPRWHMSMMWPLVLWGVLTTVLIILLIYRSTLTMHEDDQLFLGESESHMEKEQIELMHKLNKVTPIVKWLGAVSGVLILVIAGMWIYQGLSQQMQ